jgi:hypothetical protein
LRRVGLLACVCCLIAAAVPAPQKKTARPPAKPPATSAKKPPAKKASAKKPPAASSSKKQPAKKATTASKKRSPSSKKSKKRVPSWRTSQQVPTRERYMEIQQALISRGYLAEPPTGLWGPGCIEALKKFQASENLEPSGKLDSLTLIALGLGPKRASNGSLPQPPPANELKQP